MTTPLAALILAAGRGERMHSDLPKVLHEAAGLPLLAHVLVTVRGCGIKRVVAVVDGKSREVRSLLGKTEVVHQPKPLGTGHAVLQAYERFKDWKGDLLVLPGDAPCLCIDTLKGFIREHQRSGRVASVLTADVRGVHSYGRILRDGDKVVGIREALDIHQGERDISEVNSGMYVFRASALFHRLREVKRNSTKKEYYLTDVIDAFARSGETVGAYKIDDARQMIGVNTRRELTMAHQVLNELELERHSKNGVTILNPNQTFIAKNVRIGRDTVIHPFSWIGRGVSIGARCEIGPFAKIRSGSKIANGAVVGSFVEVVRTKIGENACVKHLSYLGDARVGKGANIGAGTITANYDGRSKHKTVIGDRAQIGCDTILVAPVRVGRDSKTGAGSVVISGRGVPSGKTVVGIPARIIKKTEKGKKR